MTHPGDPVHPAPHATLLSQPVQLGYPVIAGQDPTEVADLPLERLHRHHHRRPDHRRLQILQFGSCRLIELGGQAGEGVDMAGRHPPCGQGVMHRRQVGAHGGPPGSSLGVSGRAASATGQQARGRLAGSLIGETSSMQRDPCLEGVQPATNLLRRRHELGQPGAVTAGGVGVDQLGDQRQDPGLVHTFSLRTYVPEVKLYLVRPLL